MKSSLLLTVFLGLLCAFASLSTVEGKDQPDSYIEEELENIDAAVEQAEQAESAGADEDEDSDEEESEAVSDLEVAQERRVKKLKRRGASKKKSCPPLHKLHKAKRPHCVAKCTRTPVCYRRRHVQYLLARQRKLNLMYLKKVALIFSRKLRIMSHRFIRSRKSNRYLRRRLHALARRYKDLVARHRRLARMLGSSRGNALKLRRELKASSAAVKQSIADGNRLMGAHRKLRAERNAIARDRNKMRNARDKFRALRDAMRKNRDLWKQRHGKMTRERNAMRKARDQWKKRHADLKREKAALARRHRSMTADRNRWRKRHMDLHRRHLTLKKLLNDANRRIAQLMKAQHILHRRIAAIVRKQAACNRANASLKRQLRACQANGNRLKNAHAALTRAHNGLKHAHRVLKNKLKAALCKKDECGKCNGNGLSCARKRGAAQCHAVGDPHFRTFDGWTYNFQSDGIFRLAKHLNDFEVHNFQKRCNSCCRCSNGIAVRAGNHVVMTWGKWRNQWVRVNGKMVRTPNRRIRLDAHTSYTLTHKRLVVRYRGAQMIAYGTYWKNIYVRSPRGWSSGRSWTGMCGNNDGSAGNDRAYWGRIGLSTGNSYFSWARPQSEEELEQADLQDSLKEGMFGTHGEGFQPDNQEEENNKLANADAEHKKAVQKACGAAEGQDKKDCEFDLLAGVAKGGHHFDPVSVAAIANVRDHEKFLGVCLKSDRVFTYAKKLKAKTEKREAQGASYAFWVHPTSVDASIKDNLIMERGEGSLRITQEGAGLKVQASNSTVECKATLAVANAAPNTDPHFTQFIVSIGADGKINVYASGKLCGSAPGNGAYTPNKTDLQVQVHSGSNSQVEVARLFYLTLPLEPGVGMDRYTHRRMPKCKRQKKGETEELEVEETPEWEEDDAEDQE
eukprot:CAMPEP_0114554660 /NCGR_PEP_ID=MMETSP0114-20121206/8331_1 /TAXON_ID=31324 /ORGANISM="Goniomonas sp, Strain m" /LENGTH=905 /DNA_ID=CAMNT_0001739727 /DNA_START=21 /DNA_END=2738 /DNA_ORIENTATION=-